MRARRPPRAFRYRRRRPRALPRMPSRGASSWPPPRACSSRGRAPVWASGRWPRTRPRRPSRHPRANPCERHRMTARRGAAIVALLFGAATVVVAVAEAVANFPNGIVVLACLGLGVAAAWYGIRRRGAARTAGLGAGALLLLGSIVLVLVQRSPLE